VSWKLKDIDGHIVDVNVQAIYVPACPFRLLSPQQLSRAPKMIKHNGAWVGGGSTAKVFYQGHCIEFSFDQTSQLPIAKTKPGSMKFAAFAMRCHGCTSNASPRLLNAKLNSNLTAIQAKLLLAHNKLNHVAFDRIKGWAAQGKFGLDPALARCRMNGLVCAACQFGAAHKQPHNNESSINEKDSIVSPGDFVALDQMISKIPGLIPFTSGRRSKRRFTCSNMHVDAVSKFIFSDLKESTNGVQAVKSKEAFEELTRNNDVHINHYRCDNGIYQSKLFTTHVSIEGQSQSFSGIGAHWQNALAERYIGVTTTKAWIMLLHAMSRWPDVITGEFWSFAYQFAVLLCNTLPRSRSTANSADECPYETFTMSNSPIMPENFHVFGSPCFVLFCFVLFWNQHLQTAIHTPNGKNVATMAFTSAIRRNTLVTLLSSTIPPLDS
jgi:hypothetical protein